MRTKNKMANICHSLRKKTKIYPVLKSPTHIGFIGVKKNGSKISHFGTFKQIEQSSGSGKFRERHSSFAYVTVHPRDEHMIYSIQKNEIYINRRSLWQ
jgi:hypothetical protein